jgi:hypothetical protein
MKNNALMLSMGGIVLALMGFAAGRAHPAHNYRPFPSGAYVYDTHTGKACYPFREAQNQADAVNAANGKERPELSKNAADMTPGCGSE